MARHGVDVRLATEATPELVGGLDADEVVVATGALPTRTGFSSVSPLVERLPGTEQENVLTVWDVLLESRSVGERVVVLDDDGTRYAAGVTEVLLDRGARVELVSRWNALFPVTLYTLDMATLYNRLFSKGLRYRLNRWAKSIDGDRVTIFNLYTGSEETIEADFVVLATGPSANDDLYLALTGRQARPRHLRGELAGRELWSPAERYM